MINIGILHIINQYPISFSDFLCPGKTEKEDVVQIIFIYSLQIHFKIIRGSSKNYSVVKYTGIFSEKDNETKIKI